MGKGGGCGQSKAVAPVSVQDKPGSKTASPAKGNADGKAAKEHTGELPLELRAAMIIQRWFRRHKAALALRAKCSWQVFTRMEFQSEQEQLGLSDFFADLGQLKEALEKERSKAHAALAPAPGGRRRSVGEESAHAIKKRVGHNLMAAESVVSAATEDQLFDRPNKPSNVSPSMLKDLIKGCQQDQIISGELLMCLLDESFQAQKTYPNIRKMGTDVTRRVTVVGDLHGQFADLILIFKREGIPSATNPYIFNGDIVDRGPKSVELCAVILGFQLLYPHSVFVNRGNHEDYLMNKRYGFEQEVMTKYGTRASKLLRAFGALFSALPYCTIIDREVFVVHGGVSDDMDLEVLEHLQRQHYVSVLRAAKASAVQDADTQVKTAQVVNAVWSDPGKAMGCVRNQQRGGGCVWGPDVTVRFLERYDFRMIVRSHECHQGGYKWVHGRQVLTVFSASNYYAPGSNRGGYVVFRHKELDRPLVKTFDAGVGAAAAHNVTEQVGELEKAAMKELMSKVFDKKDELMREFRAADPRKTGAITVSQWADVMERVTKLSLPWLLLKDDLIKLNADHLFEYEGFTKEYTVESGNRVAVGLGVADKLYKNVGTLEYIFRLIDVDNSGHVSHEEFVVALNTLNRFLGAEIMDDDAAYKLARAVDIDKNGCIEFNEFVESFRLVRVDS